MDRSLGRGSTLDLFWNRWGGSIFSSHGTPTLYLASSTLNLFGTGWRVPISSRYGMPSWASVPVGQNSFSHFVLLRLASICMALILLEVTVCAGQPRLTLQFESESESKSESESESESGSGSESGGWVCRQPQAIVFMDRHPMWGFNPRSFCEAVGRVDLFKLCPHPTSDDLNPRSF